MPSSRVGTAQLFAAILADRVRRNRARLYQDLGRLIVQMAESGVAVDAGTPADRQWSLVREFLETTALEALDEFEKRAAPNPETLSFVLQEASQQLEAALIQEAVRAQLRLRDRQPRPQRAEAVAMIAHSGASPRLRVIAHTLEVGLASKEIGRAHPGDDQETGAPHVTVGPLHFEDLGGETFERLCFEYVSGFGDWQAIGWDGQCGHDDGADIRGTRRGGQVEVFQCANRRPLKFAKAAADIAKLWRHPEGLPHRFTLIAGTKVSANLKRRVEAHARSVGIPEVEVWSGPEIEGRLRREREDLVARFFAGRSFPARARTTQRAD